MGSDRPRRRWRADRGGRPDGSEARAPGQRATRGPHAGPGGGHARDEGWIGVASLQDAIAQVFAPDLAVARRDYLEWAADASQFAERRRFAGPGVSPDQLASLELQRVYVEPDLESDGVATRAGLASREAAKRRRVGLPRAIPTSTGSEHEPGVTKSDRRPLGHVVARHPLLVICGDAGMGKTTLLQHLELGDVAVALEATDAPIPVRFSVRHFPADGGATPRARMRSDSSAHGGRTGRSRRQRRGRPRSSTTSKGAASSCSWMVSTRRRVREERGGERHRQCTSRRIRPHAWSSRRGGRPTTSPCAGTSRSGTWRRSITTAAASSWMRNTWPDGARWRRCGVCSRENKRLADLAGNPFFLVLGALLAQADLACVRHRAQLYEKAFDHRWRDVDEDRIEWRRAVFAHVAAAQRAEGRASDQAPRLDRRIDAARAALPRRPKPRRRCGNRRWRTPGCSCGRRVAPLVLPSVVPGVPRRRRPHARADRGGPRAPPGAARRIPTPPRWSCWRSVASRMSSTSPQRPRARCSRFGAR